MKQFLTAMILVALAYGLVFVVWVSLLSPTPAEKPQADGIVVLTGGGPADRTQILPTLAYEYGMRRNLLGQGAAVIVSALPVFLGIIFLLTRRMLREKGVR